MSKIAKNKITVEALKPELLFVEFDVSADTVVTDPKRTNKTVKTFNKDFIIENLILKYATINKPPGIWQ